VASKYEATTYEVVAKGKSHGMVQNTHGKLRFQLHGWGAMNRQGSTKYKKMWRKGNPRRLLLEIHAKIESEHASARGGR